jgi:hypothetical protein
MPDFLTVDFYAHTMRGAPKWRRAAKRAVAAALPGLRSSSVNWANTGTYTLAPKPIGSCLVMAWESPAAALDAWGGPLGRTLDAAHYSLDGEVTRARVETDGDDWYGWNPSDTGAARMTGEEPMVAIVHGIVHPRNLANFLHNNLHVASRAAHHPGHRGSIDVFSKPPLENTSTSLWKTFDLAQDFAYAPGGHSHAMKHAREAKTHRTGVYLRVRPLASSGSLGVDQPAYPGLPAARRA